MFSVLYLVSTYPTTEYGFEKLDTRKSEIFENVH